MGGSLRIGLLGGTFDPVHVTHRALADAALDQLGLDQMRWVVAGQPWQKPVGRTPAHHRAAMVELTIADDPRQVLDRCELDRQGPSYTVDTVRQLQSGAVQAEWFWILGQDQYANFVTWRDWPELLQRLTLVVAVRGDQPVQAPEALQRRPHKVVRLQMPASGLSSTELRARLHAGAAPESLVPDALAPGVASYIARHGLYRD